MPRSPAPRRPLVALLHALWPALLAALPIASANAHDFKVGTLVADHPYALPSATGATEGAAHLRGLANTGDLPDQLLGASTPAAAAVELRRIRQDGQPLAPRRVAAIDLPAQAMLGLRHDGDWQLALLGLKAPLRAGDRITLTLRFARAGERALPFTVQQPRDSAAAPAHQH